MRIKSSLNNLLGVENHLHRFRVPAHTTTNVTIRRLILLPCVYPTDVSITPSTRWYANSNQKIIFSEAHFISADLI
jgi:hypothetical protein